MNIAHLILVIWALESSCGKNLNHADGSLGHLGVKSDTIDFVNKRLKLSWNVDAMQDRDFSFQFAQQAIRLYIRDYPEATEWDIFAMWRAGRTGMIHMNMAQRAYCARAMTMLKALKVGNVKWMEVE